MPGCHPGEASSLPVLPVPDPAGRAALRAALAALLYPAAMASSPGAGQHHPPVYCEGMVYYPSTGGPSGAGQAGQEHGKGFSNDSYLYEQDQCTLFSFKNHPSTPPAYDH